MDSFIDSLPKVELHMHLEGSLEPAMMFELAQRNRIDIPFDSVDEVEAAYQFTHLQDFLDIYYQGMNVLQTEQDFHDLTSAYLERVHTDRVRHVEVFFDPQGHTDRGIAFETVLSGITAALAEAEMTLGMTSKLIMCFLRHLPEEAAMKTLESALPYREHIIGVGLDSSEVGFPPAGFSRVFARARANGFRIVAHAGEEGPPEYVWQALDDLRVDRIDHGNRALEDDKLVARLVRDQIPLTVCPLSNLKLCVVDNLVNHPLRRMLELGLMVTVNSDDPAYFGGYMNANYQAVTRALKLDKSDVLTLAHNGIDASFLDADDKARLHREVSESEEV